MDQFSKNIPLFEKVLSGGDRTLSAGNLVHNIILAGTNLLFNARLADFYLNIFKFSCQNLL